MRYDGTVINEIGEKSYSSHWVLMTKNVIPNSLGETYSNQCNLITNHSKKTVLPYELPSALDAATCILMEHVQTGNRLFNDKPWVYTLCQEKLHNNNWPVIVGGFASDGLSLHSCNYIRNIFYSRRNYGVAGSWKFTSEITI